MKRIINTILFLFVAIIMMAQNSFVLTDKNGNSQLVQSLIFQHDANNHQFSWKTVSEADGYLADRDVRNLLFIARVKNELLSGTADEVTSALEEISGTDNADAAAVAAALQNNPNVESAVTEDDLNVIVKMNNSDTHIVYPLYEDFSLFAGDDFIDESPQYGINKARRARYMGDLYRGKIAIFNYFQGMSNYKAQNRIVRFIERMFTLHGYDVEFYGNTDNPTYLGNIEYDQMFNHHNLSEALQNSRDYKAIIIFSHGFEWNGKSYFTTCEKVNPGPESEILQYYGQEGQDEYYCTYPVELLKAKGNCIVYLGSCSGVPKDLSFLDENNTAFIGWNGKNCVAQADAALLFYYLLYEDYGLEKAFVSSFMVDPRYSTHKYKSQSVNDQIKLDGEKNKYMDNGMVVTVNGDIFVDESTNKKYNIIEGWFNNMWKQDFYKITLEPLFVPDRTMPYKCVWDQDFKVCLSYDNLPEGLYLYKVERNVSAGVFERVPISNTDRHLLYSISLKANASKPVSSADVYSPTINDTNGQLVEEITVAAGSSEEFAIDGYSGHTFKTATLNKDIAGVSVNGTTLTVTGVSIGETYIGVMDEQNKQMAVAKVTVGTAVSHSCPDEKHPHMIDLGLPSGTLWACCNLGAKKAEDFGGYYSWGETKTKNSYSWSNYIYCDGSYETCHNIGVDIAGSEYDAATSNWGAPWLMPSYEQFRELIDNCTSKSITQNGVEGHKFIGPNGFSIFLPIAGRRCDDMPSYNWIGFYWTSTLNDHADAWGIRINNHGSITFEEYGGCYIGKSIRPVTLGNIPPKHSSCPDNNHPHMINLGLPSGTKWACCNVGAHKPESYGWYFAWGETKMKDIYTFDTYQFNQRDNYINIGSDIAGTQYDAATVNWGAPWKMPTIEQIKELIDNCSSDWITWNGVNGRKMTGPNGCTIFLPAAGFYTGAISWNEIIGNYWSSVISNEDNFCAHGLGFNNESIEVHIFGSIGGQAVRPVFK